MSQRINPTITWVNDKASTTGKTVKVYLMHPTFAQGVTHFANIPAHLAPEKWDVVEADTVKLGDIETDYEDPNTGLRVELKVPRRQVSFFGAVALADGEELPATEWVDKRTKKGSAPAPSVDDSF